MQHQRHNKLHLYVGKEYILCFLVAFLFFFFIFFVNQILVLAQKILLKNVHLSDVLILVVLSIPQFLMYTMPFSSLAAASMVIGNMSSQNEILALRASGFNVLHIFLPIVAISLVLSGCTLFIADRLIPYTTDHYKNLYAKILESVPTLELESYSSTQFNDISISNGYVNGNIIEELVIYDDSDASQSRVISAKKGKIVVLDIERFLYRIDLEDAQLLITDKNSLESYSYASASSMSVYLDLGSATSSFVNISPSQMSLTQLKEAASELEADVTSQNNYNQSSISKEASKLGENLFEIENNTQGASLNKSIQSARNLKSQKSNSSYNFYYQYYRSEYQKKIALSLACTILVFIAFPISFFRVRNGRLIGFALSMFVACAYWFFLYFMHVKAVSANVNVILLMWLPNIVVLTVGLVLLWRTKK